jgi:PIN domain nuclease of toxin-antitoxin system
LDVGTLPGELHNDPADRLIVATARAMRVPIVTRDAPILRYAAAGYVAAMEC